jgi:hypothetical protein
MPVPGNELQAPAPKAPALPPSGPARLDASNIDGNYFVNCSKPDGSTASRMFYYNPLNPWQNVGHKPTDDVEVNNSTYIDWTQPSSGIVHTAACLCIRILISVVTFPNTSITVHWSVFGGSDMHAINTTVGTASNGYEYFWMFKDEGQVLYEDGNWTCYSEFWVY